MPAELLQIVPLLPPAISGVGDYALLLARELAASHGVQTRFLNGDPAWHGQAASVAPFPAQPVRARSADGLLEALGRCSSAGQVVLLHYVGYGYARRGCPFWLVRGLEEWKRRTGGRLIVLFHELSGSGPVWTSGFWTSGMQTRLAARLARLAEGCRITTEVAARRLRAMLPPGGRAVRTLAVFSTVGEPVTHVPAGQRQPQMVVFGSGHWRKAAYTRYLPELTEACRRLQIERLIDVGTPIGLRPELPVPFHETGVLAAAEASEVMSRSRAGFFTYPVRHIGKSTIFAAYCAHGLTPVTFPSNLMEGDENLRPNQHFLAFPGPASPPLDESALNAVAASTRTWYRQHRLEVHAREIYRDLMDLPESDARRKPATTPADENR